MKDRDIDPDRIRTVSALYEERLRPVLDSMKREGWNGRPLLVEEVEDYPFPQYFAWTGTQRVEAAKRIGLESVPCRLITAGEADAAFRGAGYDRHGGLCWRDAIAVSEGRLDQDRKAALERAGLTEAAEIMRAEIEAPDGSG